MKSKKKMPKGKKGMNPFMKEGSKAEEALDKKQMMKGKKVKGM